MNITCPYCGDAMPDINAYRCPCGGSTRVHKHIMEAPKVIPLEGIKYDSGKPDMALLSPIALLEITKVLDFGKKKYAAHNWRKGMAWSRLLSASLRHIFAFVGGESLDPESGLSHLAHAVCCLMFLLEFEKTRIELDDRYKAKGKK
jgi:hypothetical protein